MGGVLGIRDQCNYTPSFCWGQPHLPCPVGDRGRVQSGDTGLYPARVPCPGSLKGEPKLIGHGRQFRDGCAYYHRLWY
jgi:hypothetical protein